MLLPNIERAVIDLRKLTDYVLNTSHPEGRHKARVFLSSLGITVADGEWLANTILASLWKSEAELQSHIHWGAIYRVDMEVVQGQRCAKVRTGWLCGAEAARLVTCFVVGECDETT
ncbi:MAG: hypothetical protein AW09_001807 [Candidatus Accumulibacter phosphatis]|uniref:DUF6883 domain-containing protein n=1 Tax=Candidatus Accumulibacter phosphatis TaxID=327160 RepID=A0A080LWD1_9PROT|nr:MAG: hypothetical protein AW09_001807 [Candidatus Accumulibacter phosphatis]HCZ15432.1 hypothetical protein [Accumulibacter sp.]